MVRVERISFSTPPTLLKQFDDSLKMLGYKDRSKALQIAMRNFVTEYAWKEREDEQGAGAILLTYDHESHGLQEGPHRRTASISRSRQLDHSYSPRPISMSGDNIGQRRNRPYSEIGEADNEETWRDTAQAVNSCHIGQLEFGDGSRK